MVLRFCQNLFILIVGIGCQLIAALRDREDGENDERVGHGQKTLGQRDRELLDEFGRLSNLSKDEVAIR